MQPFGPSPGGPSTRDLAPFVAMLVGWTAAERLAVAGLRRVWLRLTVEGRARVAAHARALSAIAEGADGDGASTGTH